MEIKYLGYLDKEYFSRYSKDRMISDGENKFLEYSSQVDFSSLPYIEHTITARDLNKLTVIANAYYENPLYWWIIAMVNGILDPFTTPEIGEKIKIPYKDDVIRIYNKLVR